VGSALSTASMIVFSSLVYSASPEPPSQAVGREFLPVRAAIRTSKQLSSSSSCSPWPLRVTRRTGRVRTG